MDVRALAPALLGLAEVIQGSHELLRPDQPPPSVNIRATGEGSFMVDLQVVHEEVVHLLTGNEVGSLLVVVGLVQSTRGVLNFFRRRRQQGATEQTLPNGDIRITLPDGTVIEFPQEVVALSQQTRIRRGTMEIIGPLERDGVDSVQVTSPQDTSGGVRITSEDLPAMRQSLEDESRGDLVTNVTYNQRLTITSPNFQAGNKWRLSEGDTWWWMSMDDREFRARVDRGEVAFRKNDQLAAIVQLQQWREPSGELHTERSIVEVTDYIPAPVYRAAQLFGQHQDEEAGDPGPEDGSNTDA